MTFPDEDLPAVAEASHQVVDVAKAVISGFSIFEVPSRAETLA